MKSNRTIYMAWFAVVLPFLIVLALLPSLAPEPAKANAQDEKDKPLVRRPVQPKADADPDEDRVFVWPQPEEGTQTLLILKVIDKETVDAAYLVPMRLKVSYGGKDDLDKLVMGKLLQAQLKGRTKNGLIDADIWLGKSEGGWLSKKK